MKQHLALSLAVVLLAGCGGGGGSSSVPGAKTQAKTVTGSVVISIPVASSTTQSSARNARYPQFVSPNASSVAININGGSDTFFDVSPTSPLCTTVASVRNCTLSFGAPAGTDTFGFLVFSGTNGTGTQLASATTSQAIAAAQAFNFTVALNAAIGTVVANIVGASQGNCPGQPNNSNSNTINEGCPGGAVNTVTVMDPSGAVVTGTAPYASPITITASDPSLSASPNTITAPGQTSTVTYNGNAFQPGVTTSVTFDLTVGGVVIPLSVPVRRSYLYVANSNAPFGASAPLPGNGNVVVYTFGANGTPTPTRTLSGGSTTFITPAIPLVDGAGNLYVLDQGTGSPSFNPTIKVFAPGANGNMAPTRQITIGSTMGNAACSSMVFDPTGQFLFLSCGTDMYVISATTSGTPTILAQYEDECNSGPVGLAFDQTGNFYAANTSLNEISIFPASLFKTSGGFQPLLCASSSLDGTGGSAVWPSTVAPLEIVLDNTGTLYAPLWFQSPTGGAPDSVAELGIWKSTSVCNNCAASGTLTGAPFSTHAVAGIALDSAGNVYVSNPFTNLITVFARATVTGAIAGTNNATALRTISDTTTTASTAIYMTVGP